MTRTVTQECEWEVSNSATNSMRYSFLGTFYLSFAQQSATSEKDFASPSYQPARGPPHKPMNASGWHGQ